MINRQDKRPIYDQLVEILRNKIETEMQPNYLFYNSNVVITTLEREGIMINRQDKRPIYDQLVEILRNKIETEMQPNDRMLSERKICDEYGVSRTTVRLAMASTELVEQLLDLQWRI